MIKSKRRLFLLMACVLLAFGRLALAQGDDLEFVLDTGANTTPLPKIFAPDMDLSGRGFNSEASWPQSLAAGAVLEAWQKSIGFNGAYRLQYNLWEISQLAKDKVLQNKLLDNYDSVIKQISDAGGIVILNIFSTPLGLGKVLDKKSSPLNLEFFKELIKNYIRELSCKKKYNIWYEVWSAPDLDNFFLGRQQEYLNLYRAVAESVKELEAETKIHIPVGGPSVSSWFRNYENNTVLTPERSLIYELIRFCYHYKLPLNFISWHAYSTDPKIEKELTRYNKTSVNLIRDWLSYFGFERDTPLLVDEWNYDSGENLSAARKEKANISASYIPSRLKNMHEAGIDYQTLFSLEDFQNNKEGVVRNVGAFWFSQDPAGYKGGAKSAHNVLRMLGSLGKDLLASSSKINDEFVGVIATKKQEDYALLIYNYIDPDIARNYLSRNIALVSDGERAQILSVLKSKRLEKILRKELEVAKLHVTNKVKNLFKKAQELNDNAQKFMTVPRNLNLVLKNLKDNYGYQRYVVDAACGLGCDFAPKQEKEISAAESSQENLVLNPYSVQLIILQKKAKELPSPQQPEIVKEVLGVPVVEAPKEKEKAQDALQTKEPEKPAAAEEAVKAPAASDKEDKDPAAVLSGED